LTKGLRVTLAFGIALVGMAAFAGWEAWRWRRERDAQCAAVQPLIASRARLGDLRTLRPGRPPGEYSAEGTAQLIRAFGASSDKGESIRRNIRDGGRVLVFSESNSVMLVYMDHESTAVRAECFLQ
jgi:hypothetical protein